MVKFPKLGFDCALVPLARLAYRKVRLGLEGELRTRKQSHFISRPEQDKLSGHALTSTKLVEHLAGGGTDN